MRDWVRFEARHGNWRKPSNAVMTRSPPDLSASATPLRLEIAERAWRFIQAMNGRFGMSCGRSLRAAHRPEWVDSGLSASEVMA